MTTPFSELTTITTLSEALDRLFHDRHLVRGIRIDGHNNHTYTFKVYHERRDENDTRKNVCIEPLTNFSHGIESAVREAFSRTPEVELATELEHDIVLSGIQNYVKPGNAAKLITPSPSISLPTAALYRGHDIRQRPLMRVSAPTMTGVTGLMNVQAIDKALRHNKYESHVLINTGEHPVVRV